MLHTRAAELLADDAPTGYSVSLAASWHVAFDRLAADEPAALELLALCAQLAPEPIPFTLFTAHADALPGGLGAVVGDPLTFARLTRLLRTRSLARVEADSVQLHRLVQAVLRSRSAGEVAEPDMAVAAVRLLRAAVPAPPSWYDTSIWSEWRWLLPHVLTATDASRALDHAGDDVAWLLDRAASYLQAVGEPAASLPLFERALQRRRRVLGEDHPDTLTSARNLAVDLWTEGEYEAARRLDEDVLTSASNLAYDLWVTGEYELALSVLSDDHPDTLRSASDLATYLRELRKYVAAQRLDEDVLARRRRVLGDDHPDTRMSVENLLIDLLMLRYEAARQFEKDTRCRVLGGRAPRHPGLGQQPRR